MAPAALRQRALLGLHGDDPLGGFTRPRLMIEHDDFAPEQDAAAVEAAEASAALLRQARFRRPTNPLVAALLTKRAERVTPASPEDRETVRRMLAPLPATGGFYDDLDSLLSALAGEGEPGVEASLEGRWDSLRIMDLGHRIARVRRHLRGMGRQP